MLFNSIFGRKNFASSTSSNGVRANKKNHQPRHFAFEPLESRELLTVTTGSIDNNAYNEIRATYPEFQLPELQANLNVITITPNAQSGQLSLSDLKSAISSAASTPQSDLILVQTSADANRIAYTSRTSEISIAIDAAHYGSVTIIGWGTEQLTLDADEHCRVMKIEGESSVVNLGGLTIQNGYVDGSGGGIYNTGTLRVHNCTISDNYAMSFDENSALGGGVYSFGVLSIVNSTVAGNTADSSEYFSGYGGGIYSKNGSATVINCTITDNTAGDGSGIFETEYQLNGPVIEGNGLGGGIYAYGGTMNIYNSIIVSNNANEDSDICKRKKAVINGYNNLTSYDEWNANVNNIDYQENIPLFVSKEIGYYHLLPDSQAIDQGNNQYGSNVGLNASSKDLAGNQRISNSAIDLGAYELEDNFAYSTVVTTLIDRIDLKDGKWSLREAICYAPDYVTITFAENLEGTINLKWGQLSLSKALAIEGQGRITIDGGQKNRIFYVSGGTEDTPVVLDGLTIQNGIANEYGGGIYNEGAISIVDCNVVNNSAGVSGGGIFNDDLLTITNSVISGNNVTYDNIPDDETVLVSGGGIFNSGSLTITNSAIYSNNVSSEEQDDYILIGGGGVYNGGSATITNSAIARNTASGRVSFGGGIDTSGNINLYNSIIASNTDSSGNDINTYRGSEFPTGVVTGCNNLSSYISWDMNNNYRYDPASPLFVNADLHDYSLDTDSQAINKGNNQYALAAGLDETSNDLSGAPRIANSIIDIGPYEYQGEIFVEPEVDYTIVTTLLDVVDPEDGLWSLREAIDYATEYVTITFAEDLEGAIVLTQGQIEINKALAINGDNRIVIDAQQNSRVFYIAAGTTENTVAFNGLTIQNGKSDYGGGINNIGGVLTITNCTIADNTASQNAGGIYVQSNGSLTMTNTVLSNNYASAGGGIYQLNSTSTITDCTFTENMAARYGGGFYQYSGESTLTNVSLSNNIAVEYGGGVYLSSSSTTITDCTITNNTANYGGGISSNARILTINSSEISGNIATSIGGGIRIGWGNVDISNSSIVNNVTYTGDGGGIYLDRSGEVTVSSTDISGNKSYQNGNGGGIYSAGTFTITDSSILNNSVTNFGGAVYNLGEFTIEDSDISGNTALMGGGVYNAINPESMYHYLGGSQNTVFCATNCTISANTASEKGGGIYNDSDSDDPGMPDQSLPEINLINCTVAGNSATEESIGNSTTNGSGIYNNSGALKLENSIVSLNYNDNIFGTISEDNNNLINHPDPGFVVSPIFDSEGNLTNASTMDLHIRAGYVAEDIGNENNNNPGGGQSEEPIVYSSVVNTRNDSFDPYDDEWSLREAVYYAEEYVTITFAPELNGEIFLTRGQIVIDKPLTIEGDGRIIIDGSEKSQIFYIDAGTQSAPVVLNDLVIRNGSANMGAGIYQKNGYTTISDCIISSNTASSSGGGIYVYTGQFIIDNSTVTNNNASSGAGFDQLYGTSTITNSTISFNTASNYGGGIYNYAGNTTIVNCAVYGNSATQGGGMYEIGTNSIKNCTFSGNTATQGGAFYNLGKLTINNSVVSMNKASSGGGIYNNANQSDTVDIYDSIVSLNFANDDSINVYGPINRSNPSEDRRNLIGSYNPGFVIAPSFDSQGGLANPNKIDLHLRSDSVAIDRGNNTAISGFETDLAGNNRIKGSRVDIGAYEYLFNRNDQPLVYSSVVNTLNDSFNPNDNEWSLREAIYYAPDNSMITFADYLKGTIVLSLGHLAIEKPLSIDGDSRITIDADRKGRSFYIHTGSASAAVVLNGLTVQHGISNNGGGIYQSDSVVTVNNCTIIDNIASTNGGGYLLAGGSLLMTNSVLSGNASASGGAVYQSGGSFTITNCTIADNEATSNGGGLYAVSPGSSSMYNTLVVRNSASDGNDIALSAGSLNAHNNISSYTGWNMTDNHVYAPISPLFVNADIRDYRLDSGSPAINRGNSQYALASGLDQTSTDRSGESRFIGESVDIGAYESTEFSASQSDIYAGSVDFSWKQYKNAVNVRLTWVTNTSSSVLGTFGSVGAYTWDTTQFANGYGVLKAEYLDENSNVLLASAYDGLILNNDSVVIHRDNISESETWKADKVHVLARSVFVANNSNLTIAPNAVVKFWNNAHIDTTAGSTLNVQNDVIFTRFEDDNVLGDTNLDGVLSKPGIGALYTGGVGTNNIDNSVVMKYVVLDVEGEISSDQTWQNGCIYHVTDNVTVKSGAALTILPGAIIKFDSEKSLIVESGAALIAEGTENQPIVFTSVKDDDFGGDNNNDADYTAPNYGDWNQIRVSGTANLDHVIIRYAGSNTSGINGALFGTDGCVVTLNNSVVEFSRFDAISASGGTFTVVNTVVRGGKSALVNFQSLTCKATFVNCTFADAVMFIRCGWGKTSFFNCIASDFTYKFVSSSCTSTFKNCVFWNSKGVGEQSFYVVNQNNNIWANPLFRNPSKGDYHLMAGSPCIDAGTADNAPETDISGSVRASDPHVEGDGVIDIGAYEFVEREQTTIDLEALQILAPASVTPGQPTQIRWTIANNGSTIAKGSWTDAIYLVNEITGQTVRVKEYTHDGSIGANAVQTFSEEFVIPYVTDGLWKFQLRVNINRDLYEGSANDNNVVLSETASEISTAELTESQGLFSITKSQSTVYRVNLEAGKTFYMTTSSSYPVSIYMRENAVPNASSYDYIANQFDNNCQALYIAPSDTDRTFYLLAETSANNASIEYDIQYNYSLSVISVSPQQISNKGRSTLSFTGTGFNSGMTVCLKSGSQTIAGTNLTVLSDSSAIATFDMLDKPLGAYTLVVSMNAQTVSCPTPVNVKAGKGANINSWLELPSSFRDERIYSAKLHYENTGDCDALLPGFTIGSQDGTLLGWSADSVTQTELFALCFGSKESAGILKAGESGYVTFYFLAKDVTTITTSPWNSDISNIADSLYWSSWDSFQSDLSNAVTRLSLRGKTNLKYEDVYTHLLNQKTGLESNGLSGVLRDVRTNEPLSGVSLTASWDNGNRYDSAITDENGRYVFNFLPTNTQLTIATPDSYSLSKTTVYLGESDYNNFNLTALPYGAISGRIISEEGEAIENLLVLAWSEDGNYGVAYTDSKGKYEITNLPLGQYSVDVESAGVYNAPEIKNINVNSNQKYLGIDFELTLGTGYTPQDSLSSDEFTTIVNTFDELTFPESAQDLNVFRLNDDTFTGFNLIRAIYISNYTTADDVILVDSSRTISLNGMPIEYYIDDEQYGSVSILGIGEQHAGIQVNAEYPTFYISSGVLQVGAVDFIAIATDDSWRNLSSIFDHLMTSDLSLIAGDVRTQEVNYFDKQGNNIFETYFELVEEDGEFYYTEIAVPIVSDALPIIPEDSFFVSTNDQLAASADYSNNYVIIFSGGVNIDDNKPKYYSNIKDIYQACVNVYHIPRNNIYLLYADGKSTKADRYGTNSSKVNSDMSFANGSNIYSATYSNFSSVCSTIKNKISSNPDAHILIYTYDHGGTGTKNGKEYQFLCGWNGDSIDDSDFATLTNFGSAWTTYVLLQCRSGGMLEDIGRKNNVCGLSSVTKKQNNVGNESKGFAYEFKKFFQNSNNSITAYNLYNSVLSSPSYKDYRAKGYAGKLLIDGVYQYRPMDPQWFGNSFTIFSNGYQYVLETPTLSKLTSYKEDNRTYFLYGYKMVNYAPNYESTAVFDFGNNESYTLNFSGYNFHVNSNGTYTINGKTYNDISMSGLKTGYYCGCGILDPKDYYKLNFCGKITLKVTFRLVDGNKASKWSNTITSVYVPKSKDPNEIIGPMGGDFVWHDEGTEDEPFRVIDGKNWITNNPEQENDYKIFFENQKTAGAAAQEITVTTTLPEEMDWDTFEVDQISIGREVYTLSNESLIDDNTWLVNQTSTGEQIKIRYSFDPQTGEAKWYMRSYVSDTFDNFPEDAYDGFLPPNDDNHSGEGYISYHVKYKSDLNTGDVVSTNASIIFDHNETIDTNLWLNTIDVDIPEVQMENAELVDGCVALTWSGSDVGSGIYQYQIYVSTDGAAYTLWNTFDADVTNAVFETQTPGEYSFYILAVDGAGNIGGDPEQATPPLLIASEMDMRIVKERNEHVSTDEISENLASITDWDDFYMEFWTENANEFEAGKSFTATINYDPTLFVVDTNQVIVTPEGITAEIVDMGTIAGAGLSSVQITFTVGEDDYTAPGANAYWGAVHFTPNLAQDAGVQNVLESTAINLTANGKESGTTVKAMPFDLDHNSSVDVSDFIAFATAYGKSSDSLDPSDANYAQTCLSDFDSNGVVDVQDFIAFATNYGIKKGAAANYYKASNPENPPASPAQPAAVIVNQEELNEDESSNLPIQPEAAPQNLESVETVVTILEQSPKFLIPAPPTHTESVQALRQAHSSALLDLYDNQNEPVAAELSAPAIDEALYQDDEFDFLFDDSDLDADDNSDSSVDLSVVLDALELDLI